MTKIEWTDTTWNPFVGCSVVSAGCKRCYAMRQAERLAGPLQVAAYEGTARDGVWTGVVNRSSDRTFFEPLRMKRPRMIFVNSMSDFWHASAPDGWRAEALEIIERTPQHTYQILTKRPENIAPMLDRISRSLPSNVWLGASVENRAALGRINILRRIEASIRFVSAEPLLEALGTFDLGGIQWLIAGAESGSGARPCRCEWVRALRDQCVAAGVAFFYKQHAENGRKVSLPLLDGRVWRDYPQQIAATG